MWMNYPPPLPGTWKSLRDIKVNHKYVSAEREKLHRISSRDFAFEEKCQKKQIANLRTRERLSHYETLKKKGNHDYSKVPPRYLADAEKHWKGVRKIFIHRNGDSTSHPICIALNERDRSDLLWWGPTVKTIAQRLRVDYIKSFHKRNGEEVQTPNQLENGQVYVAVCRLEKFIRVPYKDPIVATRQISIKRDTGRCYMNAPNERSINSKRGCYNSHSQGNKIFSVPSMEENRQTSFREQNGNIKARHCVEKRKKKFWESDRDIGVNSMEIRDLQPKHNITKKERDTITGNKNPKEQEFHFIEEIKKLSSSIPHLSKAKFPSCPSFYKRKSSVNDVPFERKVKSEANTLAQQKLYLKQANYTKFLYFDGKPKIRYNNVTGSKYENKTFDNKKVFPQKHHVNMKSETREKACQTDTIPEMYINYIFKQFYYQLVKLHEMSYHRRPEKHCIRKRTKKIKTNKKNTIIRLTEHQHRKNYNKTLFRWLSKTKNNIAFWIHYFKNCDRMVRTKYQMKETGEHGSRSTSEVSIGRPKGSHEANSSDADSAPSDATYTVSSTHTEDPSIRSHDFNRENTSNKGLTSASSTETVDEEILKEESSLTMEELALEAEYLKEPFEEYSSDE